MSMSDCRKPLKVWGKNQCINCSSLYPATSNKIRITYCLLHEKQKLYVCNKQREKGTKEQLVKAKVLAVKKVNANISSGIRQAGHFSVYGIMQSHKPLMTR